MKGSMSSRVLFLSMLTEGMCISCFHWMVYIKIEFYSNIFNIDFKTFKNVAQKGINQRRSTYPIYHSNRLHWIYFITFFIESFYLIRFLTWEDETINAWMRIIYRLKTCNIHVLHALCNVNITIFLFHYQS